MHHVVERVGDERAEPRVIGGGAAGEPGVSARIVAHEQPSGRVVATDDRNTPPRLQARHSVGIDATEPEVIRVEAHRPKRTKVPAFRFGSTTGRP